MIVAEAWSEAGQTVSALQGSVACGSGKGAFLKFLQINKAGQRLECSHFKPDCTLGLRSLPIVIYCHCNSGSRRDAEEALHQLLPNGITVFTLDFAVRSRLDLSPLCILNIVCKPSLMLAF